jgi:hypothetical protein
MNSNEYIVKESKGALTVKAYAGDRCVLLAFNLDARKTAGLAGFAVLRKSSSDAKGTWLGNRLSFSTPAATVGSSNQSKFFPSNIAPFQKFWWIDFPPSPLEGAVTYQIVVKRFKSAESDELEDDETLDLSIQLGHLDGKSVQIAFTRGYLSSQAYADKFSDKPYTEKIAKGEWKFDAKPYEAQWAWLGGHAREVIFEFLKECATDKHCKLDAFTYDLNEPNFIEALCGIAKEGRLRLLADDSKEHAADTAASKAFSDIKNAGSNNEDAFKQGHFGRFQHNKVLIKCDKNGKAQKVLMGSTNYSITGLYVNANHVVILDDQEIANFYEEAFTAALKAKLKCAAYYEESIAKTEFPEGIHAISAMKFSFAPHKPPTFSLKTLLSDITHAKSSVIFAVMDLDGKSEVLKELTNIHKNKKIFSYGISDSRESDPEDSKVDRDATTVYTPSSASGVLVYSKANPEKFPPPFKDELEVKGPAAHVVHHKFVVLDFNGDNPVVFCGSSNLADKGEELNGDNLAAINDGAIATAFAIEGIRLVDHYAFAAALRATEDGGHDPQPLCLKLDGERWWARYYKEGDIREKERLLFAGD